jgi:hypothetical protein
LVELNGGLDGRLGDSTGVVPALAGSPRSSLAVARGDRSNTLPGTTSQASGEKATQLVAWVIGRTYLHVPVNIKHERPLAKVGHYVVLLLLETNDGIQLPLDILEGNVFERDSCGLLAVYPNKSISRAIKEVVTVPILPRATRQLSRQQAT